MLLSGESVGGDIVGLGGLQQFDVRQTPGFKVFERFDVARVFHA